MRAARQFIAASLSVLLLAIAWIAAPVTSALAQAPMNQSWRTHFWGMELLPPELGIDLQASFYLDRDGDLIIRAEYHPTDPEFTRVVYFYSTSRREILIRFRFQPATGPVERPMMDEVFAAEVGLRRLSPSDRLVLPDGTTVRPRRTTTRCNPNYDAYYSLHDPNNGELAARMVVKILGEREVYRYSIDCEEIVTGRRTVRDSDFVRILGRDLGNVLFDLGDGTWLATDGYYDIRKSVTIIRFKGFLESAYLAERPDIYLIDKDELERVFRTEGLLAAPINLAPIEYANQRAYEHLISKRAAPATVPRSAR